MRSPGRRAQAQRRRRPTAASIIVSAALASTSIQAAPETSQPERPATGEVRSRAPASQTLRVSILPRREGAQLPSATDTSLRESVRRGLKRAGAGLVESGSTRLEGESCAELECLDSLRQTLGVRYVIQASFTAIDRDYTLRLDLIDTRDTSVVATFDDRCSLCGLAEARQRTEAGAAGLIAPLLVAPIPPTTLALRTDPAGALVAIDGAPVGRAPFERIMEPGRHRLEVSAEGYVASTQEIELARGEENSLLLALAPTPTLPPSRVPGGLLLALGLPLAAGGLGVLAVDGRSRPLGCDPTTMMMCSEFTTAWPGALLLATGAIVTTLGAVLIHRVRRARPRRGRSASP